MEKGLNNARKNVVKWKHGYGRTIFEREIVRSNNLEHKKRTIDRKRVE